VASVCDGAVAAFWFEQAYAYRSHAVIHALDLVSVELKLAHDRGREVNPADAQLGKCDRPLRASQQSSWLIWPTSRAPPTANLVPIDPRNRAFRGLDPPITPLRKMRSGV
jgi:hypothetical protein